MSTEREQVEAQLAEELRYHIDGRGVVDMNGAALSTPSELLVTLLEAHRALVAARLKLAGVERERDEAQRMYLVAERAFTIQDALTVEGRAEKLNALQISKAWLLLEQRAESASLKLAAADRLAEAYADHVCACEQPYCGAQPVGVFRCERCGKCCADSLRSALLEYSRTKV